MRVGGWRVVGPGRGLRLGHRFARGLALGTCVCVRAAFGDWKLCVCPPDDKHGREGFILGSAFLSV